MGQKHSRSHLKLISKAEKLEDANNLDGAKQIYRQAARKWPKLGYPHRAIGKIALLQNDPDSALKHFSTAFKKQHTIPFERYLQIAQDPNLLWCSASKIKHDLEQFSYLIKKKRLSPGFRSKMAGYEALYNHLIDNGIVGRFKLTPALLKTLGPLYNRAIYMHQPGRLPKPAMNPKLKFMDLERKYFAKKDGLLFFVERGPCPFAPPLPRIHHVV